MCVHEYLLVNTINLQVLKTSFIDFVCVFLPGTLCDIHSDFLEKNVYYFITSPAKIAGMFRVGEILRFTEMDDQPWSPRGCYQVSVFLRYKHQSFGKGCNMAIGKGTSLRWGVGFCWVVSCWVVERSRFIG